MHALDTIYLVASFILFIGLISTEMLMLQVMYLLASTIYFVTGLLFDIPAMSFVNACFIVINVYQIIRILYERREVKLPAHLKILYEQVFNNMRHREFLNFIRLGQVGSIEKEEYVYRKNDTKNYLLLITSGTVGIEINGRIKKELKE